MSNINKKHPTPNMAEKAAERAARAARRKQAEDLAKAEGPDPTAVEALADALAECLKGG